MDKIEGYGPPTDKTVGAVGQIYCDLETKKEYVCVEAYHLDGYKIEKTKYDWEPTGNVDVLAMIGAHTHKVKDIENYDDTLATDEELSDAIENLKQEIGGGSSEGVQIFAEFLD